MIEDKDAIESLNKVGRKGQESESKLSKIAKTAGKVAIGLGAMGVAGATALFGMAKKSAETTDRIDKMSQKIGISRQGFQEWDYVLSQNGMSIDTLQTGMKTLVTSIDQASEGTGKGAENFAKLGISVQDVNGNLKDQETLFNEAIVALQGMEDGTEKAKLANDLFGRSGSELMPLLNGTADSVEELKNKAHELGIVMSDESVDAGVKLTDTMDSAKRSFGAVVAEIGVKVMPIVQKLLDWIITNMPTIQRVMGKVFDFVGKAVTTASDIFSTYLMPVISAVVGWVSANWPTISSVISTVFNIVTTVIRTAVNTIKSIIGGLQWVWDKVKTVFNGVKNAIKSPIESARNLVKNAIDKIKGFFSFKISWPNIPMPHFGVSPAGWKIGDLLKGSIPRLAINWYADGAIFDKPTLFGTHQGIKGVGEAGPEAVMPISKLQEMVDFNSNRDLIAEQNELLRALLAKDVNAYIDGQKVTEAIFEPIDEKNGFRNRERELAYGGI